MGLHNEVGRMGEAFVREVLRQVGPVETSTVADLRFAGLEIEVKTARETRINQRRRGFQFCLWRDGRSGMRGDVVILLALHQTRVIPFVIPADAVSGQRMIVLAGDDPEAYAGKWALYRDCWETLIEAIEAMEAA